MEILLIAILIFVFWLGIFQMLKNIKKMLFFKINISILISYTLYFAIMNKHWDDKGFGAALFFSYAIVSHTIILFLISIFLLSIYKE
tara:strand:- start:891 stop:1151 length:261 start_codon:yes stop_codon:yes gene_type:complete